MTPTLRSTDAEALARGAGAGVIAMPADQPMHIHLQLIHEPIRLEDRLAVWRSEGLQGALVEFTGVVRGEEDGRRIVALEYEAYERMALKVMRAALHQLGRHHPCSAVEVIHRLGIVPVGEAAIWVGVASRHRQEALALLTGFMEALKRDVPVWKRRALPAGSVGNPAR